MVFPSASFYLNPPNWQQQPTQQPSVVSNDNPHLPPLPPPPPPPPPHVGGPGGGPGSSIRPGSMSERARLAKIPQPEPGLKCPRCESTNTKFCYFNNYSLSQPRHFCKTCRRYWTRGGALRNVPVGGGCRRNKKSKGNSNSKSPVSGESRQMGTSNSNAISALQSETISQFPHHHHQLPFMSSLHNLSQFGVGNLGLNFSGQTTDNMGFINIGSNNSSMNQQFPLFEPQGTTLYPFQSDRGVDPENPSSNMVGDRSMITSSSSSRVSQIAPVKMEDRNQQGLNLSRSYLGSTSENNQYWSGSNATWTDLSGLNSASSSHLL